MEKKLGFGCMRFPLLNRDDEKSVDIAQVCRMADAFLEQGFTYFDTAYLYHGGVSEKIVKEVLTDRHDREEFQLATKLPMVILKEEEDMERIFREQLEKCGVEYFDYYLLHCLTEKNYATAQRLDSFGFAQRKKAEGKIRTLGFSFHDSPELLEQILTEHPETEFVQLQLNYLDWDNRHVQAGKCYEICVRHQKLVIVMEPVRGGALAKVPEEAEKILKTYAPERSVASWAVRYAASLDNVMMVLSGMSDYEQLMDNTSYMREFQPLNEEEQQIIGKVREIIQKSIAIPCTGCQYCVEGCPQNIPIPKYFSLYNSYRQFGGNNSHFYYNTYQDRFGSASDCIGCGQCEEHCPQHLEIIKDMKLVAETFDRKN